MWLADGELRTWTGATQEVVSFVEPKSLGRHPKLGEREALEALDAAVRAYGSGLGAWPAMPVEERIGYVQEFLKRMRPARERVVELLMWEIGKSRKDSEKEFDRTIEYVDDTILALREMGPKLESHGGIHARILRAPLGVALCMGPFNYPLNETLTTVLPALLMGNTVVMKPPRLGALLFLELLEPLRVFPRGVVNVVYGDGPTVIGPIMASGRVDVFAFIGSAKVARILEKQHPMPNRLRTILGLEAKNPAIVLPDADLDLAVKECVTGSLSFNGQRCTALKLLFVHRSIHDAFLAKFTAAVAALRCGMPWDPDVRITPIEDPKRMTALVEDAKGPKVTVRGNLFVPAVVDGVRPGMRLYTEEQFGPVVPIASFEKVEEPLKWLVDMPVGQQASVFGRAPELIAPLQNLVCRVNLNSQCQRGPDAYPFTGRKDSAEGTLSITDALRCFSIRTMVASKDGALL